MNIRRLLPIVILASTLASCAGGPKIQIDDDVRKSIRTVSIDSDVALPDKIRYNSHTQNITANFGLIGMLIGDSDKNKKTDALEAAMKSQGIDMPDMVYKKFAREMAKRTPYKPLKQGSSSDATMSIDVHLYGLEAGGVDGHMFPQVTVSAQMKDAVGDVIWRNRATVGPLQKNNEAKYSYAELIAKPSRLEEILNDAAGLAAETVLADL